jgi:hypothetical protein
MRFAMRLCFCLNGLACSDSSSGREKKIGRTVYENETCAKVMKDLNVRQNDEATKAFVARVKDDTDDGMPSLFK